LLAETIRALNTKYTDVGTGSATYVVLCDLWQGSDQGRHAGIQREREEEVPESLIGCSLSHAMEIKVKYA